jgi:hypothetical protein
MAAQSTYLPGGRTELTVPLEPSAGGGMTGLGDIFSLALKARQDAEARRYHQERSAASARREAIAGQERAAAMARAMTPVVQPGPTVSAAPPDPNARLRAEAERAALMAQMAQAKAQYELPPMTTISPLFGGGYQKDINRMTGAQRSAYLPGSNTLVNPMETMTAEERKGAAGQTQINLPDGGTRLIQNPWGTNIGNATLPPGVTVGNSPSGGWGFVMQPPEQQQGQKQQGQQQGQQQPGRPGELANYAPGAYGGRNSYVLGPGGVLGSNPNG